MCNILSRPTTTTAAASSARPTTTTATASSARTTTTTQPARTAGLYSSLSSTYRPESRILSMLSCFPQRK